VIRPIIRYLKRIEYPYVYLSLALGVLFIVIFFTRFEPSPDSLNLSTASHGGHHVSTHWDNIPDLCENATITSAASGNWSNPSTWQGGVLPGPNDVVLVSASHTVTYDSASGVAACLGIKGALTFRTDANTSLKAGTVMVYEEGSLLVGTETNQIAPNVTAEIVIANRAISTAIDPDQYGTGLLAWGEVKMHGAVKSPTYVRLASEPQVGQSTLQLSQTPSGWKVGDRILLPGSRQFRPAANEQFPAEWEERTIQSISGSTITLNQALQFKHPAGRDVDGNVDFLPHVANMTRNAVIRSESPSGVRGHVMLTYRADVSSSRTWAGRPLTRSTAKPTTSAVTPSTSTTSWGQSPRHPTATSTRCRAMS
jgi:hypothetical protein